MGDFALTPSNAYLPQKITIAIGFIEPNNMEVTSRIVINNNFNGNRRETRRLGDLYTLSEARQLAFWQILIVHSQSYS